MASHLFDLITDEDDRHVEGGARDDLPSRRPPAHHPIDPVVMAKAAGRVVKEPTKKPPAANRRKRRRRIRGPPVDAFSIPEFCDRHGISVASYYRLPPEQRPVEMTVGLGRKAISHESAATWRRQREAQTIAKQQKGDE